MFNANDISLFLLASSHLVNYRHHQFCPAPSLILGTYKEETAWSPDIMEDNLPPGFRFHPTDEELITYYLAGKVSNFNFVTRAITDVDLNKCEPWELPGKAIIGEKEWYFFSLKDRKYPTGLRTNRATDAGYWKTTGKDKEIVHSGVLVGMKKTLVFYKGRAPKGEKSNWVMHEYRLQNKYPYKPTKEEWVVCRVFLKNSINKRALSPPNFGIDPNHDSPCDASDKISELGELDVTNMTNLVNTSTGFDANTNIPSNNIDPGLNWAMPNEANNLNTPHISWPSNMISSNLLSNSNILRALQFGQHGFQEQEANIMSNMNPLMMQGSSNMQGTNIDSDFSGSPSSKIMDIPLHEQQSFQLDQIWRSC